MKTALLPASTGVAARVAESAGTLRDVLRRGRANTRGQAPDYVSNLGKAVLSRPEWRRSKCVEQLVTMVLDMARRGAVEEARQFCHELEALAVSESRKMSSDASLSFAEAHMREERAQSAREEAEAALCHEQTLATVETFMAASSAYRSALEAMDDVVRAMREHV